MYATLLSASLLWHLCPTPDQHPSLIFHGTPQAVKEVNKQTRGKELHHGIILTGYRSGTLENKQKKFVSPKVTHLKVPHYTVFPRAQKCQVLDSSKEHTFEDEVLCIL